MLSRFLNGQEVSAYTKNNNLFEGVVHTNSNNEKVVLREDGKWVRLSELKHIKQCGERLNERYREDIALVVERLDPEKVKLFEINIDQLAQKVVKAANLDDNNKDLVSEAAAQLNVLSGKASASEDELKQAASAEDELSDYKKDAESEKDEISSVTDEDREAIGQVTDSLDGDKVGQIQEELMYLENRKLFLEDIKNRKERRLREEELGDDFEYDVAENYDDELLDDDLDVSFDDEYEDYYDRSTYGLPEDQVEDASDYAYDLAEDDLDRDEIINKTSEDFEMSPDEVNDLIDETVDTEWEDFTESIENWNEDAVLSLIYEHFGVDGTKHLQECGNIYDAIVRMAEDDKSRRKALREATLDSLKKAIASAISDPKKGIDFVCQKLEDGTWWGGHIQGTKVKSLDGSSSNPKDQISARFNTDEKRKELFNIARILLDDILPSIHGKIKELGLGARDAIIKDNKATSVDEAWYKRLIKSLTIGLLVSSYTNAHDFSKKVSPDNLVKQVKKRWETQLKELDRVNVPQFSYPVEPAPAV